CVVGRVEVDDHATAGEVLQRDLRAVLIGQSESGRLVSGVECGHGCPPGTSLDPRWHTAPPASIGPARGRRSRSKRPARYTGNACRGVAVVPGSSSPVLFVPAV